MRIALLIEYDGTNYCGWQTQPNGMTIQEIIENELFNILNEKVNLIASGRTDSGVHALGQVAHFDTNKVIPPESFSHILNAVLPPDIRVLNSCPVTKNFHARYDVKRKKYVYSAYISRFERPLRDRFAVRINEVDIPKMIEASKLIIGEKDFRAFSSSGSKINDFVRMVESIEIKMQGINLTIEVTGTGFLYNMVRIIAGTLIEIGYGRLDSVCITNAFKTGKREFLGKTMPAKGLTLSEVEY